MKSTILFLLLAIAPISLHAQTAAFWGADSMLYNRAGTMFTSTGVTYYTPSEFDREYNFAKIAFALMYYPIDRVAIGGDIYAAYLMGQHRNSKGEEQRGHTYGGGLSGVLHWDIVTFEYLALYAEGYAGAIFTYYDFPPGGTPYNFTVGHGAGMLVPLTGRTQLVMGFRHIHISNGKGIVPENPGYNGDGLYMGLRVRR